MPNHTAGAFDTDLRELSNKIVDAIDNAVFGELLTYMMENPRKGDHATNIAETIYYMVQGRPILEERPKADITSRQALSLST